MATNPEQRGGPPSFDEVTAERLLRGERPASGAPAAEQAVNELLTAASAPPSARELSGEARAVAAFIASRPATTGPRHARHTIRRRPPAVRPRVSHGFAAAAALGVLTIGGVAAAAYTGSLPSSIQRLAHDHIGAPHVGRPHAAPGSAASSRSKSPASALRSHGSTLPGQPGLSAMTPTTRPVPSTPSTSPRSSSASPASQRLQLCTAYASAQQRGDEHAANKAWPQLVKAAGGRDKVTAYCAPFWRNASVTPGRGNPEPHESNTAHHGPPTTAPETQTGRPPN